MKIALLLILLPVNLAAQKMLGPCRVYPPTNIWNVRVDSLPVHAKSDVWVGHIGTVAPFGLRYDATKKVILVDGTKQKWVSVSGLPGPPQSDFTSIPMPANAYIDESDRHLLLIDTSTCIVYETFNSFIQPDGSLKADAAAKWDLNSNAQRSGDPDLTSADAAGLSVTAGLLMYDEALNDTCNHAIRFTTRKTAYREFIWPATHFTSQKGTDKTFPPFGSRYRLKATFDIERSGLSQINKNILHCIAKYGLMLADNGLDWLMQFHGDARWNDADLQNLRSVVGSNIEAVDTGSLMMNESYAFAGTPSLGVVGMDKVGRATPMDANGTGAPVFDRPKVTVLKGSRALTAADNAAMLSYAGSVPITITVPKGLGEGFKSTIVQDGSGAITFAGSGASLISPRKATHTAGPGAGAVVQCTTADSCKLWGDVE